MGRGRMFPLAAASGTRARVASRVGQRRARARGARPLSGVGCGPLMCSGAARASGSSGVGVVVAAASRRTNPSSCRHADTRTSGGAVVLARRAAAGDAPAPPNNTRHAREGTRKTQTRRSARLQARQGGRAVDGGAWARGLCISTRRASQGFTSRENCGELNTMNEWKMELIANPPTPWPNWQAPASTRKLADHYGARGRGWASSSPPRVRFLCQRQRGRLGLAAAPRGRGWAAFFIAPWKCR